MPNFVHKIWNLNGMGNLLNCSMSLFISLDGHSAKKPILQKIVKP